MGGLLLASVSLPLSGVAHADNGDSSCKVKDFCAFTKTGFAGNLWSWFGQDDDWPSVIDEDEESVWNRSTTYYARVYDKTGYGSFMYCAPPNSSYGSIRHKNDGNSHTWNNKCLP